MRLKKLLPVALFAGLTALGAFLRIPVGYTSFTLQTFFCCLAGLLLGPFRGAASQAVYVLLGLTGVPVFAQGGGLMYFAVPSAGFLLGLIPMAFTVGLLRNLLKKTSPCRLLLANIGGLFVLYVCALPYLYLSLGNVSFRDTLIYGCLIYLPFDLIKLLATALLGARLLPIVQKATHEY